MFFFLCGLYTKVSSTEVIWYLYPKQTLENTERQAKMNNPEKLAIFDTKNTAQYKIRCYVVSDAVSKKNNTFRNYMYLESRWIFAGFVVCLLPVVTSNPSQERCTRYNIM